MGFLEEEEARWRQVPGSEGEFTRLEQNGKAT